jgi:quinol-cytochrome oxidoreductase complex cytochrome b subunit
VQNYYFAFQVIQVFLVATLGASAAAVVQSVKDDPASAPSLLANNIPTASTFYLSYFILQGLSVVANVLLGVVGLIVFKLLGKLLDNTPRKMYKRWISLSGLGWGTLFPIYTNLFVS